MAQSNKALAAMDHLIKIGMEPESIRDSLLDDGFRIGVKAIDARRKKLFEEGWLGGPSEGEVSQSVSQ